VKDPEKSIKMSSDSGCCRVSCTVREGVLVMAFPDGSTCHAQQGIMKQSFIFSEGFDVAGGADAFDIVAPSRFYQGLD
jgi:hypothetical protein